MNHMMEIEDKANKLNPSYRAVSAVKVNRARQREAHRIDIENKVTAAVGRGDYYSLIDGCYVVCCVAANVGNGITITTFTWSL
jgi:hypothetical protein